MTPDEYHEIHESENVRKVRVEACVGQITFEYLDENDVLRKFTVTGGELTAEFTDTRVRKLIANGKYV